VKFKFQHRPLTLAGLYEEGRSRNISAADLLGAWLGYLTKEVVPSTGVVETVFRFLVKDSPFRTEVFFFFCDGADSFSCFDNKIHWHLVIS